MPGSEILRSLRLLSRSSGGLLSGPERVTRCLTRSMATEAQINTTTASSPVPGTAWAPTPALVMTYDFPSMEPVRMVEYPEKHLLMPIRKDLLHRAVIYEADISRHGTASTKWRDDVNGSHRKLYPKRALAVPVLSPVRRGGGVAHGPHPRDFSTDLPAKVYDQAWRIALSHRFQRGELIVIDNEISLPSESTPFLVKNILETNGWNSRKGRSTFITEDVDLELLVKMEKFSKHAKLMGRTDLDVKKLLETGRLIIEKKALDRILKAHSRDLNNRPARALY
ncbi:50S ribosomal protein L4 [Penicillium alfredii]|uniref:Large ribosomal subunit protein uL4m n=1 Tax=Penicillium alfredii TaxID=1506179 RepID=A0A9W9FKQ3_9EURO|nr:50S ribosomal protein L4 [Penicillium alfredii]KAJ5101870.1 50S ribosomal protein L4 [Penicillium alfredii]